MDKTKKHKVPFYKKQYLVTIYVTNFVKPKSLHLS